MHQHRTHYDLFILGSPNSVDGVLSPISVNRIEKAMELQKVNPEIIILATGGFGSHFNTSTIPHRELVHRHLLQQGALIDPGTPDDLLSSNTVEDVVMIQQISIPRGQEKYGIVTSKFHMARCRYIFECLAGAIDVDFYSADDPSNLDPDIIRHEALALAQLQAQGGVLIGDFLHAHVPPT
jgi:uncharacterized SAM-binding protein YcdF (DUF218 family)